MADLEKVINGLEETEIMLKQAVDRGGEMAVMGAFKCYNHVSDAISLLKEQEPKRMWICNGELCCPQCGALCKSYYHYCNECGQAVKWDE